VNNSYKVLILILLIGGNLLIGEARVVAAISSMKGNVKIRSANQRKFDTAYKAQMIRTGDWLKTDKNVFVAIVFLDGSMVKIQSNTEIEIKSSRITAKELKTQMYISEGQAWSKISKQNNGEFRIKTPTAVASVKGTEFDVDFDDMSESTSLVVLEGEVEFGNELGTVIAGAMQGASVTQDEAPVEYTVAPEDLPIWQNNTNPAWEILLTPNKTGKQSVNQPIKISIQMINSITNEVENGFNNEVQVSVDSELLFVSIDGSTWSGNAKISIKDGKGTFLVMGGGEGKPSIIVSSEDSETSKLQLEFFISKSQKKSIGGKVSALASKIGISAIVDAIEGKSLKSAIASGEVNIEDVLQKVDTGELEIIDHQKIDNSDGSVTIKLIIKPSSQGSSQ
jgi:hypothetical protein